MAASKRRWTQGLLVVVATFLTMLGLVLGGRALVREPWVVRYGITEPRPTDSELRYDLLASGEPAAPPWAEGVRVVPPKDTLAASASSSVPGGAGAAAENRLADPVSEAAETRGSHPVRLSGPMDSNEKLGALLQRQGIAPVSRWYRGFMVAEIPEQAPRNDASAPSAPGASYDGGRLAARGLKVFGQVSSPRLAATAFGAERSDAPGPCTVVIRWRKGDTWATVERPLAEGVSCAWLNLLAYGEGAGLIVHLRVLRQEPASVIGVVGWTAVLALQSPSWEPQLLMDSQRLEQEIELVGDTPDERLVYVSATQGRGPSSRTALWELDTRSLRARLVSRDAPLTRLLPSPDAGLLAVGCSIGIAAGYDDFRVPVQVLDVRTGAIYEVTSQASGNYVHDPQAWSARVPGRLYYVDQDRQLWQVDLPKELLKRSASPTGHKGR